MVQVVNIETRQVMPLDDFLNSMGIASITHGKLADVIKSFGYAPVLNGPQPSPGEFEVVEPDGVEMIDGLWFTKFRVVSMFKDHTVIGGRVVTADEQLDAAKAQRIDAWRRGTTITAFQGRAALADAGHLPAVETAMSDPATPQKIKLAWSYAPEWPRKSELVTAISSAAKLTNEQMDDLFRSAIRMVL